MQSENMDTNIFNPGRFPVIQEFYKVQHQNSDGGSDFHLPDLDFIYGDTDSFQNEIAEIYSYSEQPEFQLNLKAFEIQMDKYKLKPFWQPLTDKERKSVIMKLLDQLEVNNKELRMTAARCILYIVQGCWLEAQSDNEQQEFSKHNAVLLYRLGVFNSFIDLLNIEIEVSYPESYLNKENVSLESSKDLRVILSVLCTITEIMLHEKLNFESKFKEDVENFILDLTSVNKEELLAVKLFNMVTKFCGGRAQHFPMKKVLLLLWKIILITLGGMEELKNVKKERRVKAGLLDFDSDTLDIAKFMRPSSPPANAADLLEAQNQKANPRPLRKSLVKQSSLNDDDSMKLEIGDMSEETDLYYMQLEEKANVHQVKKVSFSRPLDLTTEKGLPWKPKVRQQDIDAFLESARMKFLGFNVIGDRESVAGLPPPILEGIKILKEHLYTSLAELQIKREEEITRNPLSTEEFVIENTPSEMLYQAMLPHLPQYMIALLKILLAAAPTSKLKTESINIMSDVLPEELPTTLEESMKVGKDVGRHKEIIVKAISATLLLLLKHFKANHIYQFEFMSQHLVFANCVLLILKFFNQNIMLYIGAANNIPILDFPSFLIGEQPEITAESVQIGADAPYTWRNLFACINLLRVLNKLTKGKQSRIMMLVIFKSAPILKRLLKIRLGICQLYVLKLLKMQARYLGRQWRKSNMKTISAIYCKVRHRFNDDWVFGNDVDKKPWDFQSEECSLRLPIDRFNSRRYSDSIKDSEFEPVDNCLLSVLGKEPDLPENFKKHYGLWVSEQVEEDPIDWEKLLFSPITF